MNIKEITKYEPQITTVLATLPKEINPADKINDVEFVEYKAVRTLINKEIKVVSEARLELTRGLDKVKKALIAEERRVTAPLTAIEEQLTATIQGKQAFIQLEKNKMEMPERIARLTSEDIAFDKKEIETMDSKTFETFISSKLQAREDIENDKVLKRKLKKLNYNENTDIIVDDKLYRFVGKL